MGKDTGAGASAQKQGKVNNSGFNWRSQKSGRIIFIIRKDDSMKGYNVIIKETINMTVSVEAESATQAREIVENNWKNGDYHILDADHFKGVTISTKARSDRDR